jgi:hypothetical protein
LELALNQLHLTEHGFIRGGQRDIYPRWLHQSTAEVFILSKINQTKDKKIMQYGTLTKILLPDIKAYVRDNEAIVTLVRRRRKVR